MDSDRLAELGIKALKRSFQRHEELGEKGLESVQINPHGDTSLLGDIEAEKDVIG